MSGHIVECPGIDGANPLGFLSALGVARVLHLADPEVRMSWARRRTWVPSYEFHLASADDPWAAATEHLSTWLLALARAGEGGDEKAVKALKAELKKVLKAVKEAEQRAKGEARLQHLDKAAREALVKGAAPDERLRLASIENELGAAQEGVTNALGLGVAHLGPIIGVPCSLFRGQAQAAADGWLAAPFATEPAPRVDPPGLVTDLLVALASDGVTESGRVVPTPYSFGNGASNQCLLKDFRACAARCTQARVAASLIGGGSALAVEDGVTSLNWDPADERSYALRWADPATAASKAPVDVAANALAYLGLALLPAMPGPRGLLAACWAPSRLSWPIWGGTVTLSVVRSLLGLRDLQADAPDRARLTARGVLDVRRSRRVTVNKRFFFSPSVSI